MIPIEQISYEDIEPNKDYETVIEKVLQTCFEEEKLQKQNLMVNLILATPAYIQAINKQYRNMDKPTDVLSFPMFEKEEIESRLQKNACEIPEVLGDIIISIPRVQEQAKEYGHSFERELAYMVVHGFYHLMGYDHMEEQEKNIMRQKEEKILNKEKIYR